MQQMRDCRILLTIAFLIPVLFFFIIPVSAAGTETLITSNVSADQAKPSIYGNYIAWVDSRNGISQDIYLYNTATLQESRITDGSAVVDSPDIQGSRVVWSQDGRDIYWYDISSGQIHKIPLDDASRFTPKIFGDRIVWTEQRIFNSGPHNDILMYDTGTNLTYNLTSGQPETDQEKPAISGTIVVWEDHRRFSGNYDIYGVDTSALDPAAWIEKPVCTVTGDKTSPAISGDIVVWQDARTSYLYPHIHSANFSTTTEIWNSSRDDSFFDQQYSPSVYGNSVVWLDTWPDFGTYIGMYTGNTNETKEPLTSTLTNIPSYDSPPRIYQNHIVWQDVRSGISQIYLFTDGIDVTCPVADFRQDNATVNPGEMVHFFDTSTPVPDTWFWEFGDGTYSAEQNPYHSYADMGTYAVMLSVGNDSCRSTTSFGSHQVSVAAVPSVDFRATPLTGMAPLTVTFNGSSTGNPDTWYWDFGDGTAGSVQNVSHVYATEGTYSVRLNATNAIGTGTKLKTDYIHVLSGGHEVSTTPIDGITIENRFGGHFLFYDTGILPDFTLSGPVLVSRPPRVYGWQNVTFLTSDRPGFFSNGSVISGNLTGIIFQIREIQATGFSPTLGSFPSVGYQATLPSYPDNGSLKTDVWESATGPDNLTNQNIIHQSGFSSINDLAYTMDISRTGFGAFDEFSINMSVGADWIAGFEGIDLGRNSTFVIATGHDSGGNYYGMVLNAVHLFHDPVTNLDCFSSDIPAQYSFLSRFSLAKLSGSGNPIQLVTLTIVSIISPESDTGGSGDVIYTPGDVKVTQTPEIKPTSLPGTGKTVRLYTNDHGIITQATTLQAADGLASVFIRRGVVAKNTTGAAPSSITINSLPADTLPDSPDGSGFSYAGMAYDLQPDGCTFSPSISLNFTLPQARWGQDFMVKMYDETTITWREVPTTYNPDTGIVTAELSHFCPVALFARAVIPAPPGAVTDIPTQIPTTPAAPPAPTAFSMFFSMVLWVIDGAIKNIILTAGLVILAVAIFLYGRKRRRDRIMYLL